MIPDSLPTDVPEPVDKAIRRTIEEEGSIFTDDPHDKPTKYGIIQDDLNACDHEGDLRDLTFAQAYRIYFDKYWYAPRFDIIANVSLPVAEELFDTRVLMGPRHAVRWLQRTLNSYNWQNRYGVDLVVDGIAGTRTAERLDSLFQHRTTQGGTEAILFALNAFQYTRMVSISENENDDPPNRLRKYVWGWQQNRAMEDLA